MNPPHGRAASGFYWAKVRYNYSPEPLIHWEVLHWEDGHWWSTASSIPFSTDDVLEFKERLVAPADDE